MSDNTNGFDPEYDDKKESNVMYYGECKHNKVGSTYRKVELLIEESESYLSEQNKESGSVPVEFQIKNSTTLYQSRGGQQKIYCWLIETTTGKYYDAIHIARRTGKGVYGSQEVTLTYEAALALRAFLNSLTFIDIKERMTIPINLQNTGEEQSNQILSKDEFNELIKANIKNTDDFYKLLSIQKMNLAVERLEQIILGNYKNEVEIQRFLKQNIWMFGNDYIHIIENGVVNAENILDMIPQDFESYIDIIEVKLPSEKLFNFDESHNNYYTTAHLTKAIAQTQNYIFELEQKTADKEYQRNNGCKVIRPKGLILYGGQSKLSEDEQKYLRILNSSYHNLQIITYHQLLEKANNTLRIWKENKQ